MEEKEFELAASATQETAAAENVTDENTPGTDMAQADTASLTGKDDYVSADGNSPSDTEGADSALEQGDYSATAASRDFTAHSETQARPYLQQADSAFAFANSQLEIYRHRETLKMIADDLAAVQTVDPSVTSLSDLPDSFFALRFNPLAPVDAAKAYALAKAVEGGVNMQKPASVGVIDGESGGESRFFTGDELDRLTPKMLDNPKIMEKALRSIARLK